MAKCDMEAGAKTFNFLSEKHFEWSLFRDSPDKGTYQFEYQGCVIEQRSPGVHDLAMCQIEYCA